MLNLQQFSANIKHIVQVLIIWDPGKLASLMSDAVLPYSQHFQHQIFDVQVQIFSSHRSIPCLFPLPMQTHTILLARHLSMIDQMRRVAL